MKSTVLSSPARTRLLRFVVHNRDSVEIIQTSWTGGSTIQSTERWLPEPEAANYRARLIRDGWRESQGDCVR